MEKNEQWKEIGEVINYLFQGGRVENKRGSVLHYDHPSRSIIITYADGETEVAKLAGEVLVYNWRKIK